ncbi:MAG: sigma-54 dependent transcriptional regulator [Rhizobiaceae bacterium]|nr:sigma-54 dependent transcriptional regulator [Rhizobiaceae bacterium]
MQAPILIVDDDPVQRRLSEAALTRAGFSVSVAENGEQALKALSRQPFSLVLLDMMMPGVDGLGVLSAMRGMDARPPVIVQTAQGSIDAAVRMVRAGAFDFLVKPVAPDRLATAVNAAIKVVRQEGPARSARKAAAERFTIDDLVSRSPWMDKVIRLAARAAASNIPVLVEGESGVGKEMVARAIQSQSDRRGKAFITVNCGAIPANLVESTLFGHEKGAFTGATERHDGKFVEADGGTLFLDEIGELPLEAQAKLLRAIQFSEIDPVGGRRSRTVDIRLISATNKNLLDEIRAGRFREDLFYRLNVFPIHVPPLRERREDIDALSQHFLKRFAPLMPQGRMPALDASAVELFQRHDWPGNIRELENALHRAVVLADNPVLTADDFPQIMAQLLPKRAPAVPILVSEAADALPVRAPLSDPKLPQLALLDAQGHVRPLADIEAELIAFAVGHYGGRLSEVARRLGIGRSTLYRKLADAGVETVENAE